MFNPGGEVVVTPQFRPMRGTLYVTPFDWFRFVCEVIVILSLFTLGALNLSYIGHEYRKYSNWYKEVVEDHLPPEQLAERYRVCPESMRKFKAIFDVYVLLDVVFLALNISQVISWCLIIAEKDFELKVSDTDYFEKLNHLALAYQEYQSVSAVCNVIVMLRLLKFLTINEKMGFLVKTMSRAQAAIFYYLIVLVILTMGFFLFTYAAFGSNV